MTTQDAATPVRAFISYSWSSPTHVSWVLGLATRLREDGVDVTIDKWDLKPGHDAHMFMEQMVTDKTIGKVIMVCDRIYAEKADGRSGGVGAESQIISPELYGRGQQDKYAAVTTEVDPDGKAYVPVFYGGRIYFSFETADRYETAYEELLRWLVDKPQHVKPKLGAVPAHIAGDAPIASVLVSRAKRVEDAIRNERAHATGLLREFNEGLKAELAQIKPVEKEGHARGDDTLEAVGLMRPYIRQFQDVVLTVMRFTSDSRLGDELLRGLEALADLMVRPDRPGQFSDEDQDPHKIVVGELFVTTIAIALREERFDFVERALSRTYLMREGDYGGVPTAHDFTGFQRDSLMLDRRNSALNPRRLEPRADLYREDYEGHTLGFEDIMQAEFILFLRSIAVKRLRSQWGVWRPQTLVFAERRGHAFALFSRAESMNFFMMLAPVLAVPSLEQFREIIAATEADPHRNLHRHFSRPSILTLANSEYLGTAP